MIDLFSYQSAFCRPIPIRTNSSTSVRYQPRVSTQYQDWCVPDYFYNCTSRNGSQITGQSLCFSSSSSSSVLQQISSNRCHPLPLECYGLVDQISWLACRQRVLETIFSRQSVPIEKCTWKERIFVDISSCRDGDKTCVISAACLSRRLR